jgi:hypothetical protein
MTEQQPILYALIREIEARGFYRAATTTTDLTLWTCDAWKEYWTAGDGRTKDRREKLLDVCTHLVARESGWGAIAHQPEEETP